MEQVTTTETGVIFREEPRLFTTEYLTNSHLILSSTQVLIELDGEAILFDDNFIIDGNQVQNATDIVTMLKLDLNLGS
jgi:hypothetical protein